LGLELELALEVGMDGVGGIEEIGFGVERNLGMMEPLGAFGLRDGVGGKEEGDVEMGVETLEGLDAGGCGGRAGANRVRFRGALFPRVRCMSRLYLLWAEAEASSPSPLRESIHRAFGNSAPLPLNKVVPRAALRSQVLSC